MQTVQLSVEKRDTSGKGPARRMRRAGAVPAVIYGKGQESVSVSIGLAELREALAHGQNVVLQLHYPGDKGKKHFAVVKEIQRHQTKSTIVHLDLHEIDLKQEIEAPVRIELIGTAKGIAEGGMLDHQHREVQVRALPTSVPSVLEADISDLGIGDHLTVAALSAPSGVVILDDPSVVIAAVLAPRVMEAGEEEAEAAAPEAEGGAGEE